MPVVVQTPRFHPRDLIAFRGYRQGGIAWLEYAVGTGAVYFVVGPLFAGMLPDVGWSLAVTSAALLIRGLLGIAAAPATGWLIQRFGVRPVVMTGGLFVSIFTALTGLVTTPFQFILVFGVALSLADSLMANIPAATVVQRWFLARRGTVMGFVNSGAGIGGLIFAPLTAVLIASFGWRVAMFALAGIILVLSVPSVLLKSGPRDVGQWVDGVEGRVIPEAGEEDDMGTEQNTVGQMVRRPLFWALFTIFGIEAWALGTYAAQQVIYLKGEGVGEIASSGALGISGGVAAISGILLCRLNDRISPYFVLIGTTVTMAVGSVLFLFATNVPVLFLYSILFGAGYGLLVPTIPTAFSRYFGARNFARGMGVGMIVVSVMGGLGPFVTGLIATSTGSFRLGVYLVTALLVISVIIAFASRPPAPALQSVERADDEVGPSAGPGAPAVAGQTRAAAPADDPVGSL
jgi:MFS family permease